MKRTELKRHLRDHGCMLHHHGGNHDVWLRPANMRKASVLRKSRKVRFEGFAGDSRYLCLPNSSPSIVAFHLTDRHAMVVRPHFSRPSSMPGNKRWSPANREDRSAITSHQGQGNGRKRNVGQRMF